jgi:hypothetical protein
MIPRIAAAAFVATQLLAATVVAGQQTPPSAPDTSARDSTARDTIRRDSVDRRRERGVSINIGPRDERGSGIRTGDEATGARRIPVTPQLIASAYANDATRQLVLRARAARFATDSSLQSYEVLSYQRMSARLGMKVMGRERLVIRAEQSARVWWSRGSGVMVKLTGARVAIPIVERDTEKAIEDDPAMPDIVAVPYVPGRDRLWPIGDMKMDVNGESVLHPFAEGAEAYYEYRVADSVVISMPSGPRYNLIELRITPRQQRWNAVVGSIWLDRESAQVVRSAYRFSEPLDLWIAVDAEVEKERKAGKKDDDDIPGWLRPLLSPMRMSVTAITQEFALQNQRWWLPISQTAEGLAELGPIRTPVSVEERYRYERVSGTPMPSPLDSLRTTLAARLVLADSIERMRDSAEKGREMEEKPARDSTGRRWRTALDSAQGRERDECMKTKTGDRTRIQRTGSERVIVLIPCDPVRLSQSPDLPASIYESSDEMFGETEREQLRDWAQSLKAAAELHGEGGGMPRPIIEYGLGGGLIRYNRIEGLSLGIRARQRLSPTRTAHALLRLGSADLVPGGELGIETTRALTTYDLNAYYRLSAAGDYGEPFTLGASLSALLFGRDDSFYYRAGGVELIRAPIEGEGVLWRIFAERHGNAKVGTHVSLAHIGGGRFEPNIDVSPSTSYGIGARTVRSFGLDPQGFRLLTDARAEVAGMRKGGYARGLVDATLAHPLAFETDIAITGAAGIAGARDVDGASNPGRNVVPIEKQFFVGGPRTVRGILPGSGVGEAFWLARAELAVGSIAFRPVAFFDLGWAGERRKFTTPGKPLAGTGIGLSALDGLIRLDVAKGIRPAGGVRGYLYLDARF